MSPWQRLRLHDVTPGVCVRHLVGLQLGAHGLFAGAWWLSGGFPWNLAVHPALLVLGATVYVWFVDPQPKLEHVPRRRQLAFGVAPLWAGLAVILALGAYGLGYAQEAQGGPVALVVVAAVAEAVTATLATAVGLDLGRTVFVGPPPRQPPRHKKGRP